MDSDFERKVSEFIDRSMREGRIVAPRSIIIGTPMKGVTVRRFEIQDNGNGDYCISSMSC